MLKKIEKIIRESAFEKKKKKRGLKFNPGLVLTSAWTTGPRATHTCILKNNGGHITKRHCKWCKLVNKYAQFYNIHPDAQLVINLNWLIHVRVPNNLLRVMVITQLTQNKQKKYLTLFTGTITTIELAEPTLYFTNQEIQSLMSQSVFCCPLSTYQPPTWIWYLTRLAAFRSSTGQFTNTAITCALIKAD